MAQTLGKKNSLLWTCGPHNAIKHKKVEREREREREREGGGRERDKKRYEKRGRKIDIQVFFLKS